MIKCEFLDYLEQDEEKVLDKLRRFTYDFLNAERAFEKSKDMSSDIYEWTLGVVSALQPSINNYSNDAINRIMALIIYEHARRNIKYKPQLIRFTEEYMMKGKVL